MEADAGAGLCDVLARVVEANERWERLTAQLWAENEQLRADNAALRADNERLSAELAVLQRLVFGLVVGGIAAGLACTAATAGLENSRAV